MINSGDCVDLFEKYSEGELPYMKCIEITKFTPQHFKLDKWYSTFRIPDVWMKKIYYNDRYKDTDDERSFSESEELSVGQKKVLKDYIKKRQRQDDAETLYIPAKRLRQSPPNDCLVNILANKFDEELVASSGKQRDSQDSEQSDEQTSQCSSLREITSAPNLARCYKHRMQPEETIVHIALQKMMNLKAEEEKKYRELLKDKEFMQFLDSHVEKYCRSH